MVSFNLVVAVIIALSMASSSFSFPSNHPKSITFAISAAPALQPNPPPFTEVSPDIAPLLPSPGATVPSSTGSSIPTIPANPSPPNPDATAAVGPDTAFVPSGSMPASSSACPNTLGWHSLQLAAFTGFLACLFVQLFIL